MRNNLQTTVDLAHKIRTETNDRVRVDICQGMIKDDEGHEEEYSFCKLNGSLLTAVHAPEEWERMKTLARQIVGPSISA